MHIKGLNIKKPLKVVDVQWLLIECPSEQERKEPRKSELGAQIKSTRYCAEMRIQLGFYTWRMEGNYVYYLVSKGKKNVRHGGLVALKTLYTGKRPMHNTYCNAPDDINLIFFRIDVNLWGKETFITLLYESMLTYSFSFGFWILQDNKISLYVVMWCTVLLHIM